MRYCRAVLDSEFRIPNSAFRIFSRRHHIQRFLLHAVLIQVRLHARAHVVVYIHLAVYRVVMQYIYDLARGHQRIRGYAEGLRYFLHCRQIALAALHAVYRYYKRVDMHVGGIGRPAAHFGPQRFEQGDALGCLREEVHRAREVDLTEVRLPFDHDRLVGDLPRESDHFGVAPFSEDHDLPSGRAHPFVGLDDAGLQTGDYRAGGVDHFDAQFRGPCVGRRRLPVRPDEEPAARQAGLNASRLEIRPPVSDDRAWTVNEIDRRWPTQVDAVAIDGATMQVVDRTRFADFPLMAKLTRWGVDFHMGILFGLANQLLLVGFGCALCVTIGVGYRLWWIRRPPQAAWDPAHSLLQAWLSLAWPARSLVLGLAFALGLAMPLMGASLLLFIAVDYLRWRAAMAMRMMKSSD